MNLVEICQENPPDILLICGDLAETLTGWQRALELFQNVEITKIIVPGNHDLWCRSEQEPDSYAKYRHYLGKVCRDNDWHYLPKNPWLKNNIGIVGSCCWYDYSLLPLKHPFDLKELNMKAKGGLRWMDAVACRWSSFAREPSDCEITDLFFKDLEEDLQKISKDCDFIILATHFPFYREFLDYDSVPWDRAYFGAFMGSERYKSLLSDYSIKMHICGHLHRQKFLELNGTKVFLSPVGTVKEWSTEDPEARLEQVLLKLHAENPTQG